MTMRKLNLLLLGLVFIIASSDASMCKKFRLRGPCNLLPKTTTLMTTTKSPYKGIDCPYCLMACAQHNVNAFGSLCGCATTTTTTTTTTTATTTTPKPESCYYTRNRPAKLESIGKRMYSAKPINMECEYPGVVGIYNTTSQKIICMGILLEESKIMMDQLCKNILGVAKLQNSVASLSYQKPTVFTDLPSVVVSSLKQLDPSIPVASAKVFTASLNQPVVFNDACVQPACFPNVNLPLSDVDLNDCRIVGYGDTTDTIGTPSSVLVEVKVKVDPASVAGGALNYTRQDGLNSRTGPCFYDQGAPLICNHLVTGEWVTIGIVLGAGVKCSSAKIVPAGISSLLQESTNHNLYTNLQAFKYVVVM